MPKIFMYSDLYLPTFPELDLPLYHELVKRGMPVEYVLDANDIRLKLPTTASSYQNLNLKTITSTKQVNGMMGPKDLLVMRFCYKGVGGKVADQVRASKKRILMLDPAAVDVKFRECPAQYLTVKSDWMRDQVLKKFGGRYKAIYTTGTIHFDAAWDRDEWLSKAELMEKHGLDPNKRLAILCKASSGEVGHQHGVDTEYQRIVEIVSKCSDYALLFKMHPLDHHAELPNVAGVVKSNNDLHYQGATSSAKLFPKGIKILQPDLGYNAFGVADVVLNVRSSIGMETVLFPTPLLNINSHLYTTNWPKSDNMGVMRNIKMEELEKVLNNAEYKVDAQGIVNWPFNTYNNDEIFALAVGQLIIVPDGVKPEEQPWEQPVYLAHKTPDAGAISATGNFVWPTAGSLTQYFRWYHPAVDIANRDSPDILASDAGRVMVAGWPDAVGYGNRVLIDHGNGYKTLYGHLARIFVVPGQTVGRGSAIGQMGSTGRSTGPHLHFEIIQNGVYLNPLNFLR